MKEWVAVAIGGMCGAMLRHGVSLALSWVGSAWMPIATLLVNVIGCLAIGYLFSWSTGNQSQNHWTTVGLRVGLLGGLTTFSSFALDVVRSFQTIRPSVAVGLALAHVALGIAAVLIGMAAAGAFSDSSSQPTS